MDMGRVTTTGWHEPAILTELETLARAVAADSRVRVVKGECWQVDLTSRTIEAILKPEEPVTWRRGGICHEAGHVLLTQHLEFLNADPASPIQGVSEVEAQACHAALNTIEDCRIERWLTRRLPGCAVWLADLNRSCDTSALPADLDPFSQLLLCLSTRWLPGLGGEVARATPASRDLAAALEPAVADYLACQPPVRLDQVAGAARALAGVSWPGWTPRPRADLSVSSRSRAGRPARATSSSATDLAAPQAADTDDSAAVPRWPGDPPPVARPVLAGAGRPGRVGGSRRRWWPTNGCGERRAADRRAGPGRPAPYLEPARVGLGAGRKRRAGNLSRAMGSTPGPTPERLWLRRRERPQQQTWCRSWSTSRAA